MRRVCVLLPRPGREKIRWPNRVKYPSGEECAATIRLSNAEINPLTALALDLQSSESPSLFHRFYVYPFDHDKFDFALSLSLFLSFDDDIIVAQAEEICVNYERAFATRPASNPGPGSSRRLFACRIKRRNWIMKRQSRARWSRVAGKRSEGIEKGRNGSIDT